jgi:hypothetical protein
LHIIRSAAKANPLWVCCCPMVLPRRYAVRGHRVPWRERVLRRSVRVPRWVLWSVVRGARGQRGSGGPAGLQGGRRRRVAERAAELGRGERAVRGGGLEYEGQRERGQRRVGWRDVRRGRGAGDGRGPGQRQRQWHRRGRRRAGAARRAAGAELARQPRRGRGRGASRVAGGAAVAVAGWHVGAR